MSVKEQRLSRQGKFAWPIPEALIAVDRIDVGLCISRGLVL